jgi:hypothetical protein
MKKVTRTTRTATRGTVRSSAILDRAASGNVEPDHRASSRMNEWSLERVMNSIRKGLGIGEREIGREPSRPCNPHFYVVFAQVHNTL